MDDVLEVEVMVDVVSVDSFECCEFVVGCIVVIVVIVVCDTCGVARMLVLLAMLLLLLLLLLALMVSHWWFDGSAGLNGDACGLMQAGGSAWGAIGLTGALGLL